MRNEENLEILREIYKRPQTSQKELAFKVGFSLSKLYYWLYALKNKSLL